MYIAEIDFPEIATERMFVYKELVEKLNDENWLLQGQTERGIAEIHKRIEKVRNVDERIKRLKAR